MEKKKSSSASDYDNLIRNALQFGLIERGTTPSDGNCLFHCLSIQLSEVLGRRISHADVRRDCVQFLRENPRSADGTSLANFVIGNNLGQYLQNMENGAWGDNLMLFAATHVYGVGIMVVSSLGDSATQFIHSTNAIYTTEESERNMVLLGHLAESHYISLEPLERTETTLRYEASEILSTANVDLPNNSETTDESSCTSKTNTVTAAHDSINLADIEEEIKEMINNETTAKDDNSINHFRDFRQEGTIPVGISNARVVLFIKYMESKGRKYKQFQSGFGKFVCIPEEDMATFDEKAIYMEDSKAYRLNSKALCFWLQNVCPEERRGNVTITDQEVVQIPHDIADSFDTWYDQLRFRIRITLNQ